MKTSYISPAVGELDITIIRDGTPSVTIELDLGIPNFTRFALKFPLVKEEPRNMATVTQEALGVLLDEVATFMLSLKYNQDVITDIYARALSCYSGMTMESSTQAAFDEVMQDDHVETFRGTFKLPQTFVQETQERVVTSATYIKRAPAVRKIELTQMAPAKTNIGDVQRVIKMYRNRQLKTQPRPLFVVVYDQMGKPSGVLPVQQQWKSKLLQSIQASVKKDWAKGYWYNIDSKQLFDISSDYGGGTNDHAGFLWASEGNGTKIGLSEQQVKDLQVFYHAYENDGNPEWNETCQAAVDTLLMHNIRVTLSPGGKFIGLMGISFRQLRQRGPGALNALTEITSAVQPGVKIGLEADQQFREMSLEEFLK